VASDLRMLRLDRFKGPFLKGTYSDESKKESLEAALDNARADGWMTMPPGMMVDAIDLSMGDTSEFKDAIADFEREMLVGMLGAHLMMMEGESGSPRGDTSVHKQTSELFDWHLSAVVGDVVTSQMAPPWYARNFADLPPCSVTWGSISDQDMMARAQLYEQLQKIGLKLSEKAAHQEFAVSIPAAPDDVLKPGGAGGGPDQGGPGGGPGQPPGSPPAFPPPDATFSEAGKPSVPFALTPPPGW
jgi:phage gp29-like protein